jgi:hypothetical protein
VERPVGSWFTIATSAMLNSCSLRFASVVTCGCIIRGVSTGGCRKLCSNFGVSYIQIRRCSCNYPSERKKVRLTVLEQSSGSRGQGGNLNCRRPICIWGLVKLFDQSFRIFGDWRCRKLSVNRSYISASIARASARRLFLRANREREHTKLRGLDYSDIANGLRMVADLRLDGARSCHYRDAKLGVHRLSVFDVREDV